MDQEKQDFKVISIGGIVASLVFVPVQYCTPNWCNQRGWEFIFKMSYEESINFGILFIQVLVMLVLIFGYYHIKFKD